MLRPNDIDFEIPLSEEERRLGVKPIVHRGKLLQEYPDDWMDVEVPVRQRIDGRWVESKVYNVKKAWIKDVQPR